MAQLNQGQGQGQGQDEQQQQQQAKDAKSTTTLIQRTILFLRQAWWYMQCFIFVASLVYMINNQLHKKSEAWRNLVKTIESRIKNSFDHHCHQGLIFQFFAYLIRRLIQSLRQHGPRLQRFGSMTLQIAQLATIFLLQLSLGPLIGVFVAFTLESIVHGLMNALQFGHYTDTALLIYEYWTTRGFEYAIILTWNYLVCTYIAFKYLQ